jgi:hypothetical protein
LKAGQSFKHHSLAGGLASPPDSRINSPLFLLGSTPPLNKGPLSPLRCVNPRDIFGDSNDGQEQDGSTDQESGVECLSTAPPATSEYESQADGINNVEFPMSGLDLSDDGSTVTAGVESRQPSPKIPEDDVPMRDVGSGERISKISPDVQGEEALEQSSLTQGDDSTMVGIQSRQSSPLSEENDNSMTTINSTAVDIQSRQSSPLSEDIDTIMATVKSRKGVSDKVLDVGDDREMMDVDGSVSLGEGVPEDEYMPIVELKERETVMEEVPSANEESVLEGAPANADESELDFFIADTFEPRRSARNLSAKSKLTQKSVAAPKASVVKKRIHIPKEDVPLQASFQTYTPRWGSHISFQVVYEDDRAQLSDVGAASVGFILILFNIRFLIYALNSYTQHSMLISQVGDQQSKRALKDIDTCQFR